jgi:glycosyltransferase involved in cell wall biosynthesis
MKFICLHHRLGGFSSHHFNEAHGFLQEFKRREKEFILLVPTNVPPEIVSALNARALLEDDPTFRLEWSFEERSRRFVSMLHAHVDSDLSADDCVMVTISTQLEAYALTCWLQDLQTHPKPWIVILFLSDRWNRSGREEYERQIAEFHILNARIRSLTSEDARRLIFCTVSDLLAEELSDLLGIEVGVTCMPIEYGDPKVYSLVQNHPDLPRVAILGGTRREKGSYLIPDIVRACRFRVRVEFLIQLANNSLTPQEAEKLARVANQPRVTVIREPISLSEYNAALNSLDIGLFPYEVIPYYKRTSGVFAETVAFGKPVLATRGTWMARQIEAGKAAGIIFDDLQPKTIAKTIARCVAELPALRQTAKALSAKWRETVSLSAFVDFIEQQIALRSR